MNEGRSMWIIAMFDLPTETEHDKREYRSFRKFLLNDGFTMLQYSVYQRHCGNVSVLKTHENRIIKNLPKFGKIQTFSMTDKQFGEISTFYGKKYIEDLSLKEPPQFIVI